MLNIVLTQKYICSDNLDIILQRHKRSANVSKGGMCITVTHGICLSHLVSVCIESHLVTVCIEIKLFQYVILYFFLFLHFVAFQVLLYFRYFKHFITKWNHIRNVKEQSQ